MKTLVLRAPKEFRYEEREHPVPGPEDVVVRVTGVCICGSDAGAISGTHNMFTYPRVIGHEVAGIVEETGDMVAGFNPGDRVCLMPCVPCGHCQTCRNGKTNTCRELKIIGVHIDGGLEEYLCAPQKNWLKIGDSLSPAAAAMIEPLTIGAHAVAKLDLREGERVLVIGAGPIGASCAVNALSYGAVITMADTSPVRRAYIAEKFGLTCLDPIAEDYKERILAMTKGEYFDAVIDTTANKFSMQDCWQWVTQGGRIVFVGICPTELVIDGPKFHAREPSLFVTRNSVLADYERVLRLIREGKIDPLQFVSHTVPFENAGETLAGWVSPGTSVFKGVVIF